MESTSSKAVASWIEKLNAAVVPAKQRSALHDLVLKRDINGRAFSMILNEHALSEFNLPDLSLAMGTKIRKCWHSDFPESVGIKAPGSDRGSPGDERVQRYDPCQDACPEAGDYTGFEGYAGYKPPANAGRGSPSVRGHGVGSPGVRGHSSVGSNLSSPSKPKQVSRGTPDRMVQISLEILRAALDCVAERAGIERQEIYLWVHGVIPDEVWQPLWSSYTSDLKRGQDAQRIQQAMPENQFDSQAGKNMVLGPRNGSQQRDASPDDLDQLPELRSRLHPQRQSAWPERGEFPASPDRQAWGQHYQDDDMRSNAETLRSEAKTLESDAISNWLGNTAESRASLSPLELANWLRTLPKDRLDGETLKIVARNVLNENMDEEQFCIALSSKNLDALGVSDHRQAQVLERYFKQRQEEAAMAAAAKETGALNDSFRARKGWKM